MELSSRTLWSRIERPRVLDSHVMALRWIEVIEPAFEKGAPLSNHHQWLDVAAYDSNARRAVTRWAVRRASSCADIQFVSRSKLVTMAIATVNLATALSGLTMTATTSEEDFNGRLGDALLRSVS